MDDKILLAAIGQMMRQELEPIKEDLQDLKQRVTGIEQRVTGIEQRVTGIEQRVTKIEVTQENVTNKQISLIVEGQRDTLRKFRQLDELTDKVEDIQTTVEVLRHLTVKR